MCAPRSKRHRVLRSAGSTRHETLPELTQRYTRQDYHASHPSRLRTHRPADELTSPSLCTAQQRQHFSWRGRFPRAAARLQASRGPCAHHLGLREPLISAVLKTSHTLRPSGRLDAWRRQFDASEDDLVRVAARGCRGHGPEQRARLGLAARHLRMATPARPSGRGFPRHGVSKGRGGQKRSFLAT